jgi:hypothetical protein
MTVLNILVTLCGASFLFYGVSCLVSPFMKAEFARYGLADHRILTGCLEMAGAIGLFLGLVVPLIGILASAGLSLLMLLGFLIRLKIKDGFVRSFPAFFFMVLNLWILFLYLNLE